MARAGVVEREVDVWHHRYVVDKIPLRIIARDSRRNIGTVWAHLKFRGVRMRPRQKRELTRSAIAAIVAARAGGMTQKAVSEATGWSVPTVQKVLKNNLKEAADMEAKSLEDIEDYCEGAAQAEEQIRANRRAVTDKYGLFYPLTTAKAMIDVVSMLPSDFLRSAARHPRTPKRVVLEIGRELRARARGVRPEPKVNFLPFDGEPEP